MARNCEQAELNPIDPCAVGVDEQLEQIQKMLPRGRAWTRDPDATSTKYWRSFAETIQYLDERICDLLEEFFCDTAEETLETWAEQYGIDAPGLVDLTDPCLKAGVTEQDIQDYYAQRVCAKVAAQGGNDCDYFVSTALSLGWVVTCEDVSETTYAQAGCFEVGCDALGPPGIFQGSVNLGWEDLSPCEFGPAVDHPTPEAWESIQGRNAGDGFSDGSNLGCSDSSDYRSGCLYVGFEYADREDPVIARQEAKCEVPGSELGQGYLGDDCCNLVGYYEFDPNSTFSRGSACVDDSSVNLDRQVDNTIVFPNLPLDGSKQWAEYTGHAHTLAITIDAAASMALQQAESIYEENFTLAGCTFCGDTCTPLSGWQTDRFKEQLESIIPAHIQINWSVA